MKLLLTFVGTIILTTSAFMSKPGTCPVDPAWYEGDNPCVPNTIAEGLPNIPCDEAKAQSPRDITPGADSDLLPPELDPWADFNAEGMCTVNAHWHIGSEHEMAGVFEPGCSFDHPALTANKRKLAETMRVGGMCCDGKQLWEKNDPLIQNEYDWKYCKDMHVGLTYEIHWPHSNLGDCQTKWQFQYPFIDGVLCGANIMGLTAAQAAQAVFDGVGKIGVEGQVFTIVNSGPLTTSGSPLGSEYSYPTWDSLNGWNAALVGSDENKAVYKGSTTGDGADNKMCRATGGMVTWHVDRQCHRLEAATMDNLCRLMLVVPADDLSADVAPHGSRETVRPEYTRA